MITIKSFRFAHNYLFPNVEKQKLSLSYHYLHFILQKSFNLCQLSEWWQDEMLWNSCVAMISWGAIYLLAVT